MNNEMDKNNVYLSGAEAAASRAVEQARMELAEENRKRKVKLIKFGAMMVAISIILVFATRSWFTMSREVGGTGARGTAENNYFELRFYGDNIGAKSYSPVYDENDENIVGYIPSGIYDKITPVTDMAYDLPDGVADPNAEGYYLTDGIDNRTVILRMDTNYKSPDEEDGLNPGDGGELIFWIVPKQGGNFTAKLSFSLRGYTADQSKAAPYEVNSISPIPLKAPTSGVTEEQLELIQRDMKAVEYLNTHILFFKGTETDQIDGQGNKIWTYNEFLNDDFLSDGYYEMPFTGTTKDSPIEIRVRWKWTNTFKQMVLPYGDDNPDPVTNDNAVREEIQTYAYESRNTLFKDMSDEEIQGMMMKQQLKSGTEDEYEYVFDAEKTARNLEKLSRGYNRADSAIGDSIDYMLLVLAVE